LDISQEKIEDAQNISKKSYSIDEPITNNENEELGTYEMFMQTNEKEATDYQFEYTESLSKELTRVLATLTPRERDVINMFFGR